MQWIDESRKQAPRDIIGHDSVGSSLGTCEATATATATAELNTLPQFWQQADSFYEWEKVSRSLRSAPAVAKASLHNYPHAERDTFSHS